MAGALGPEIVVFGARGMLGRDLVARFVSRGQAVIDSLEPWADVLALDRPAFDAADESAVRKALSLGPRVAFNCAAYTDVDGCEDRPDVAFHANAHLPGVLARAAKSGGVLLVHVSTDFVFDGDTDCPYTEDHPTNPLSVYGRSKLAGERAVIEAGCEHLICRTAWLYGAHGKNFVTTILRLAAERPVLRVVADQAGSPTWTADLAGMLLALVEAGARGVFHTVNSGSASWFDLACEAVRLRGLPIRVEPIPASEYPRKAALPLRSSVLSVDKYIRASGRPPRPWKAALADFLATLPPETSPSHS